MTLHPGNRREKNGGQGQKLKMKALVLCAGKGARLRPITYSMPKHLIPVANRPILDYALAKIEACALETGFVISPETGREIEDHYGPNYHYILQETPLGIAHAVKVAEGFLGREPFLLFLGDNLLEESLAKGAAEFQLLNLDALIYLKEVSDPRPYGVAVLGPKGEVLQLMEKPAIPPSRLAVVGLYFFSPRILEAIEQIRPSPRGEYEITDAVQWLIDHGYRVKGKVISSWWLDTGRKEDILEANRFLLEHELKPHLKGQLDEQSRISGRVAIEEGASIVRSQIEGPAIIGRGARVLDSKILPFTSIGDRCRIVGSEIGLSVIMEDSQLLHLSSLKGSIIGRRTVLQGKGIPLQFELHVGDEAVLKIRG